MRSTQQVIRSLAIGDRSRCRDDAGACSSSCVHQHDAPYTDIEAQQLLDHAHSPHKLCDPAFEGDCIAKVAAAIRRASPQAITHLGTGQAAVERVASNRRYVGGDGKVSFGRTSATSDPTIRNQPEGLIDPDLKTISFWSGAKPVAALYAYSLIR